MYLTWYLLHYFLWRFLHEQSSSRTIFYCMSQSSNLFSSSLPSISDMLLSCPATLSRFNLYTDSLTSLSFKIGLSSFPILHRFSTFMNSSKYPRHLYIISFRTRSIWLCLHLIWFVLRIFYFLILLKDQFWILLLSLSQFFWQILPTLLFLPTSPSRSLHFFEFCMFLSSLRQYF